MYLTTATVSGNYLKLSGGTMSGPISSSLPYLQISTNVYIVGYSSASAFYGPLYGDGTNITGLTQAYGEMYSTGSLTITDITQGIFTQVANIVSAGDLNNFTFTAGKLTYTGTKTKEFHVSVSFNIQMTAGGPDDFNFVVEKTGTQLSKSLATASLYNNTDRQCVSLNCMISLATNDNIEIWATDTTSGDDVIINNINVIVSSAGLSQ
jgi:hypothetical protein